MSTRDHYVAGQRPDWLAPRVRPMARRRNQYTPLLERPWFLAFAIVVAVAILLARAWGML